MRVEGGARAPAPEAATARFGEALARAAREGGGRGRSDEARARRAEPRPTVPRSRIAAPDQGAAAGLEEARAPVAAPAARAGDVPPELAPVEALASLVRVLPPVIASLRPPVGAALALSFGRSLEVELRATAAGVEVVLRPEPGLSRAAAAEVPRLVAALRARGVAVGRVEVRPRGQRGGRAR